MILLLKKEDYWTCSSNFTTVFQRACYVFSGDIEVRMMRLMSYFHACKVEALRAISRGVAKMKLLRGFTRGFGEGGNGFPPGKMGVLVADQASLFPLNLNLSTVYISRRQPEWSDFGSVPFESLTKLKNYGYIFVVVHYSGLKILHIS